MTIEQITTGRTGRDWTPASVATHKLDMIFELRWRHGFNKGDVLRCNHTVPVRTTIETKPIPRSKEYTETTFLDIKGGSNVTYIGPEFDYWTGKMFLRFLYEDLIVHYDFWTQHQAGDTMFATTFERITPEQA